MTFIVDPDNELPKGKGDMPSMIVAYPSCMPSVYASWGTDEEMCGPFKGKEKKEGKQGTLHSDFRSQGGCDFS